MEKADYSLAMSQRVAGKRREILSVSIRIGQVMLQEQSQTQWFKTTKTPFSHMLRNYFGSVVDSAPFNHSGTQAEEKLPSQAFISPPHPVQGLRPDAKCFGLEMTYTLCSQHIGQIESHRPISLSESQEVQSYHVARRQKAGNTW